MNRLVARSIAEINPEKLPPAAREGRARVLFLTIDALGWRTSAEQLRRYAQSRDDVDAVHLSVAPPRWMRMLNRRIPVLNLEHVAHPNTTWRWLTRGWFERAIPLDRFDVVHVAPNTAAGALVRRRQTSAGFRLSVSMDCTGQLFREISGQPALGQRQLGSEREVLRGCDFIAAWSKWVAQSVIADYGVDPSKVQVCRPVELQAPPSNGGGRIDRAPGSLCNILFVGNDFDRKGGAMLLRWHQQHFADRAMLHIVSAKAQADHSARNVVWHGGVPHERLIQQVFPAMDLFVFPTQQEPLGIVVIEAAMSGLPTVSSRVSAIPELVLDGETGLLCDRTDERAFVKAIDRLLTDDALRRRMSAQARSFAQQEFHPDNQYGRLFDRLVELAAAARRSV